MKFPQVAIIRDVDHQLPWIRMMYTDMPIGDLVIVERVSYEISRKIYNVMCSNNRTWYVHADSLEFIGEL